MPRKLLITSVILLAVGIVGSIVASNSSYVDASGMVHDSMLTPISALLIVLAVILLLVSGIMFVIKAIKK